MMWSPRVRLAFCLLWGFSLAVGGYVLFRYERTTGATGQVPEHWPSDAFVTRDPQKATLLFFAHPKCPCTRASLHELNRLLSRTRGRLAVHAFFLRPRSTDESWSQTDLRRMAAALPDVVVHDDLDGALALRFGIETSGHVLLYDRDGRLAFQGGVTAGRGHIGMSLGTQSIAAIAKGEPVSASSAPVYGCSILSDCTTTESVR